MVAREIALAVIGAVVGIASTFAALWRGRRDGPDAITTLLGRSNEFTDRLMADNTALRLRVRELEDRVAELEEQFDTYRRNHP